MQWYTTQIITCIPTTTTFFNGKIKKKERNTKLFSHLKRNYISKMNIFRKNKLLLTIFHFTMNSFLGIHYTYKFPFLLKSCYLNLNFSFVLFHCYFFFLRFLWFKVLAKVIIIAVIVHQLLNWNHYQKVISSINPSTKVSQQFIF